MAWQDERISHPPLAVGGWIRLILRAPALVVINFGCLLLLLLLRVIERPIFGLRRPLTPFITQFVCRASLAVLGIRLRQRGRVMTERGAIVANHASWLDIYTLNACARIYFVSKAEVAKWPGIGWLARATGTVFINRKSNEARAQQQVFEARLRAGHHLLFFPEGTSTDSRRILPFKSTLFAAFFAPDLREDMAIQPVTVAYHAPPGRDARFHGWWGGMGFGGHLKQVLAAPGGGAVDVVFHAPVPVAAVADRKAMAAQVEATVRHAHPMGALTPEER
ncbi:lysophospholipid acyltransferase family protein [Falsirhodobacter halotolerans]|uniref:lysophospholipid acyltransferase family protein n=1 Tax=Falsirhodobacter halotolerans TaxID=1146892 RepID=UPI001FD08193|nr:lysophospholipid acyltransferase family protein [Falsirhodobacter halotolerans]MCJ8139198.1 1-acyl-sn-glycerol-3-phosphate acyltransferase [Falsirhodobacter halotolerans]